MHTISIDMCVFLYALITDGSICFPSLFIQIIVEVHRSKSRKQSLYFLAFILRLLNFLELENFPSLELIHITTPIVATSLRQRSAQKKTVEPSVGSSKRPQIESTAGDMLAEEIPFDPTAAVAEDNVDEVDVDIVDAEPIVPHSIFLCAMMETFMMTQAAIGQLLDELITEVAALRADFLSIGVLFHILHPLILDGCLWQYVTKRGSR